MINYTLSDGRDTIAWVVTKDVPANTELRYDYGGPTPASWNADKVRINGRKRASISTGNITHHKRARK